MKLTEAYFQIWSGVKTRTGAQIKSQIWHSRIMNQVRVQVEDSQIRYQIKNKIWEEAIRNQK